MGYGYNGYEAYNNAPFAGQGAIIWLGIAAVLAIIGGIVLYFTFLSKRNDNKFKGFLGWLYDFLTFKKMFIENLLRVVYLILTLFVTLASFAAGSFLSFLGLLLLGNLSIRIIYEFSLILLVICRNTTELNKNLSKVASDVKKASENTANNIL